MNRKALEYWFSEEVEYPYSEIDSGFVLHTEELSPDTLGEIKACDGKVVATESGDTFIVRSAV